MPLARLAPDLRARARAARSAMEGAPARLWDALRGLRRRGIAHFRRAAPIGPVLATFADHGHRLVVEVVPGARVPEAAAAAAAQDAWLVAQGYRIRRFASDDVVNRLTEVMAEIESALRADPHP